MDFMSHFVAFIAVNGILFFVNMFTLFTSYTDTIWFWWITLFWGIGLVSHFISVFFSYGLTDGLKKFFYDSEIERIRNNK